MTSDRSILVRTARDAAASVASGKVPLITLRSFRDAQAKRDSGTFCCRFSLKWRTSFSMPRLARSIDLSDVKISEDSLNSLLSHCTSLEHLKIHSISKCDRLHIRSRSLKVLSTSGDFKELFIDDAPNLEQVLGYYLNSRSVKIKIAHAPKLEFLGYLGMNNEIEFGNTKFRVSLLMKQSEIDLAIASCKYLINHSN